MKKTNNLRTLTAGFRTWGAAMNHSSPVPSFESGVHAYGAFADVTEPAKVRIHPYQLLELRQEFP